MSSNTGEKKEKQGFWMAVSSFIVNKRKAIILLFIFAAIYSVICMNKVGINQDITSYLPATSETRVGLTAMNEEFITYGSARVMVCNITYTEAEALAKDLRTLNNVKEVAFDNTADHYQGSNALFDITVNGSDDAPDAIAGLDAVEALLQDYDVYVSSSVGATEKSMASLSNDMNLILVLAVLIIVAVLFISTKAFMEIPVLLITFGMAALLNKGSNFWLGEISSVTDSIAVVLQLALAIDYAIILCDRYMEEHEKLEPVEAVKVALSKAIPEISSSSLTTVSGMAAMMFMQFRLGFDMGIVLVKAILFSLVSVFFLMPGVILIFAKGIDKTMHKNFVPKISFVGKFAAATKYVIPPVFVLVIAYAFYASGNCTYLYDVNSVESATKSEAKIAQEKIDGSFGSTNQLVVMVPSGEYEKEANLIAELEGLDCVKDVTGLANQSVNDDYMVTSKLKPRQFSELTDLDIEIVRVLYMAYAYNIGQYGPVVTGVDDYSVPIIDMFLFLYEQYQEGYVTLSDELDETLTDLYDRLHDGELQLKGANYSRLVLNFDMPVEGQETYDRMEDIRAAAEKYYGAGKVILVGNSTSAHDLASSFATDNIIISVLTALFVLIILLFTFQSAGLPVLLVLTIQGSIWINFTVPALENQGIYFIAYLIVSAIQMGATIDYAIVISSRYLQLKNVMPLKQAITETLNQAFPTIFTSGTILTCAGFLIGRICSDATVAAIGVALGRGTLISIILVLFVLPQILLLGDIIIEKTALNVKLGGSNVNVFGKMVVNGYVRGEIVGRIDGEVRGIIEGRIDGSVDTRLPGQDMSISEEAHTEQAFEAEPPVKLQALDISGLKPPVVKTDTEQKETVHSDEAEEAQSKAVEKTSAAEQVSGDDKSDGKEKADGEDNGGAAPSGSVVMGKTRIPQGKAKHRFSKLFILIFAAALVLLGNSYSYADEVKTEDTEAEAEYVAETVNISSREEFLSFAENCKFDAYSIGVIFNLTEDIDLSGTDFKGVPYFNGTFEGNGHTVSGVNITPEGSTYGFFRYVGKYGIVRKLNVVGSIAASGTAKNIGGIAGDNKGTITGCIFRGSVTGGENVGGIAGVNSKTAFVIDCENHGVILATDCTGGVIGYNYGTVSGCSNSGNVNIEEVEPTIDVGGVDIGNLNLTRNFYSRNNMGGIAGYSTGVISTCVNEGTVGYEHTGYNVGGIAGGQSGIVLDCKNTGLVLGRKDVGGIVGQGEPFVESKYLNDTVDSTQAQIDELNKTLTGINSTVRKTSSKSAKYAEKIAKTTSGQTEKLSDDLTKLTDTVSKEYPEAKQYCDNINQAVDNISKIDTSGMMTSEDIAEVQKNLSVISKNLSELSKYTAGTGSQSEEMLNRVSAELKNTTQYDDASKMVKTIDKGVNSVSKSLDKALKQIDGIRNTISDAASVVSGEEDYIKDISSIETASTMDGVISGCHNEGRIKGDINVGGIVGSMNVEYSNDPEFDFSFTDEINLILRSTVNDVVINCTNEGRVVVKKNYAGGTCGLHSLGLIYNCENYGNIVGEEADYIGGIAGSSETTVQSCYVLCTVTGTDYAGGIVGMGYGINDCVAVPIINAGGAAKGSVAGSMGEETSTTGNVFCNSTYEGIDNISYLGIAEYLSYEEMLKGNVPERFKQVSVSFEHEDRVLSVIHIPYGGAISEDDYPKLSERNDAYLVWTGSADINRVTENLVMTAEYIPWTTSVAADEKGTKNRNVFLAVGEFFEDTAVTLENYDEVLVSDDLKKLAYSYRWHLNNSPEGRNETVEGHFLMPDECDSAELWILGSGAWQKADAKIDGSYLVYPIKEGDVFSVIGVHNVGPDIKKILIIAGAALAALFVLVIVVKAVKKK